MRLCQEGKKVSQNEKSSLSYILYPILDKNGLSSSMLKHFFAPMVQPPAHATNPAQTAESIGSSVRQSFIRRAKRASNWPTAAAAITTATLHRLQFQSSFEVHSSAKLYAIVNAPRRKACARVSYLFLVLRCTGWSKKCRIGCGKAS